MIASLVTVFAELLESVIRAGEDADKKEEALYAAEEKLSRVRAKMKFSK